MTAWRLSVSAGRLDTILRCTETETKVEQLQIVTVIQKPSFE